VIPAPLPQDENRRLSALRDLNILDTPPEERFDRITRIAADLLHVPIAAISLIDHDRQWFKSCAGLQGTSADRETSFCAHAIAQPDTMVVRDTTTDPRFATNPLVTGPPNIRFYAGHPLLAAGGERVGTLCLVDFVPHDFSDEDERRLRDLAAWAQSELNRADDTALQAQVRRADERFWTTLQAIGDGIVSFDPDGTIRAANAAAERNFGARPGELTGEHVDSLVLELTLADVGQLIGLDGGSGEALGAMATMTGLRRDGSKFPMEITINRANIDDEDLFVAVGRDISDRVEAERALHESESLQRAMFENARVGLAIADPDAGGLLQVNPAFCEMVGATTEELREIGYVPLVHPDGDLSDAEDIMRWALAGAEGEMERTLLFRRRNGTSFLGNLTVYGIAREGGRSSYVVGVLVDVTEMRENERMKDEFVSVVGHELRTPLTSIRGSLGLIAGGVVGEIPPEAAAMLDVALSNADRLVRLVNDILDIERIDAGHVQLERMPVSALHLVDLSFPVIQATADEAGVRLSFGGEDVTVLADADRIVQTLVNLLSNAIKFSPPNGEVSVTVGHEGGDAVFTVRDQGRGIPAEQLDRIFERFRQVDASDAREKGGTGLGLAIAQRIVERHDGRIWAESPAEGGAVMRFTLPMGRTDLAVLICGTIEDDVEAVTAIVEALGCTAVRVLDPAGVEAAVARRRPSAVIVPIVDGTEEWAVAVRDTATAAGIPVVAMGGMVDGGAESDLVGLLRAVVPELTPGGVLIVEDDPSLAELLTLLLSRTGGGNGAARVVGTADDAVAAIRQAAPAAVVLDLVLPGGKDGFDVVERLRGEGLLDNVPVLVYTALDLRAGDRERLQLGNTEFMTKSEVSPQDIQRRVRELLAEPEVDAP
jgi:PAS domain S-box-containing protein